MAKNAHWKCIQQTGVQTTPKLSKDINICLVRCILDPKFSILSVIFGILIVIILLHGNSSTFTSRTQAPWPLKSTKPWIPLIKSSFKVTGSEVDIYTQVHTQSPHLHSLLSKDLLRLLCWFFQQMSEVQLLHLKLDTYFSFPVSQQSVSCIQQHTSTCKQSCNPQPFRLFWKTPVAGESCHISLCTNAFFL